MKDLQDKINNIVQDYINDGFNKKLEETIISAINKNIENMFSYGTLDKQLRNGLEESLKIDFSNLKLPEFSRIIIDIVKSKTVEVLHEQVQSRLASELEEMLKPAPKEITVQGLIDLFKEEYKEDCSCEYGQDIEIEIIKCEYGGYNLKVWNDGKTRTSIYRDTIKNEPCFYLYISEKNKTISIIHDLKISAQFGTSNFGFYGKLFLMYAQGTVITDINEVDVYDLDLTLYNYED